ncbi:MAG TPA: GDP-mannose 4,6-dehydratase [Candidatus Dormibacteraeota bacterium]
MTGGAGFIGSHLTDRLLDEGHQVAVIDDLSSGFAELVNGEAEFHQVSVVGEEAEVVVRSYRPEVIFHLAAQIDVRTSVRDPLHDAEVNVLGTVRMLQAAVGSSTRRFVLMSSGGALYGDTDQVPTPESHPWRPASPYGAAKAAGEAYLAAFSASFGLETAALRPGNVYGPRQDPHGEAGVVATFADLLLAGQAPVINGDGAQTRDYIYVGDVVAAAVLLLDGPLGRYNLGTGRETSVVELAQELRQVAAELRPGGEPVPPAKHGPARDGEQRRSCLDSTRAARELGWSAQVPLAEGLRSTVAYFAERG